jgi:hypothetical protein
VNTIMNIRFLKSRYFFLLAEHYQLLKKDTAPRSSLTYFLKQTFSVLCQLSGIRSSELILKQLISQTFGRISCTRYRSVKRPLLTQYKTTKQNRKMLIYKHAPNTIRARNNNVRAVLNLTHLKSRFPSY